MALKKFNEFVNEWWDSPTPPDDDRRFTEPDNSGEWTVLATDGSEHALAERDGVKHLVYFGHVPRAEMAEFASREIIPRRGEDGWEEDYSDDWEIDSAVVQGWLNSKADVSIGKGIDDWESGDFDAVEATPDVVRSVLELVSKYDDSKDLVAALDGIS